MGESWWQVRSQASVEHTPTLMILLRWNVLGLELPYWPVVGAIVRASREGSMEVTHNERRAADIMFHPMLHPHLGMCSCVYFDGSSYVLPSALATTMTAACAPLWNLC